LIAFGNFTGEFSPNVSDHKTVVNNPLASAVSQGTTVTVIKNQDQIFGYYGDRTSLRTFGASDPPDAWTHGAHF
jgi:hypothetical protein